MGQFKDLTGLRFGRLLVVKRVDNAGERTQWQALCDCGGTGVFLSGSLVSGKTGSCGCYRKEVTARNATRMHTTHGRTRTPEYKAFDSAKQRCTNPGEKDYAKYGGRGIEFRFNSFDEWYAELGEKPEPKHSYSVDRIDNDGHYEVGNVRWATYAEQVRNRRPWSEWKPTQVAA